MKDIKTVLLLDYYGSLLTDKQQDILDLYYNQDMSLAEIAEEYGISRQAVMDAIKRGENLLASFEERLKMAEKFSKLKAKVDECIDLNEQQNHTKARAKLQEIKAVLED